MIESELNKIETELRKRLAFPYKWFRKQNDLWDRNSNFIYTTSGWEHLLDKIDYRKKCFPGEEVQFFNYCINRWYNFQSAQAVEKIFTSIDGIEPHLNSKDRLVDFTFFGIQVDHKTSIFPAKYSDSIEFAQKNPEKLIKWLYQNQSQQQRKHYGNRLFLIVYSNSGAHWKLKSEIMWLKTNIEDYVATFEALQWKEFNFGTGKRTVSDIIWAIK